MNLVLPDTSAYSLAIRGHREIEEVLRQAETIFISPVMLGELHAGFRKSDSGRKLENTLRTFLASERVRQIAIDQDTADRYAIITDGLRRSGTPLPTNNVWIAAGAMQYGLTVLTADAHFRKIPQILCTFFSPLLPERS